MSDLLSIADLRHQKAELEALIQSIDSPSDIVAKMNYESRLRSISEKLQLAEQKDANIAEVSVLFDGSPVRGTSSIDAGFAAHALLHFQGIVTRLFSSSLKGQLQSKGKIKGSDLAQLNLSGLATGSFGFVLEEKNADQSSVMKTPLREAIEEAAALFEELSQEDDEDFLIDVNDINPRVFNEISSFFNHLEKNNATFKAHLRDKSCSLDHAAIHRAYTRISATEVNIRKETWIGKLVGLTPIKRSFEFRKHDEQTVHTGKFSQQISQDYLERIERHDGFMLGATYRATIEVGTLRKPDGSVSTTYTALDLQEVSE
ncbi:hypothetical protein [Thalassovita sp.]|uniref:hypothetical protein n=1 Tax=Thalassovita sp. TaxID=1979401 RepID=UPI002B26FED5|nr:hypothetical protein [Thalassovita sp.]